MIDLGFPRNAPRLRHLKWACTFTASVALMVAAGVTINWAANLDTYHWSTVPIALTVAAIALAARNAVAVRLGDRRREIHAEQD